MSNDPIDIPVRVTDVDVPVYLPGGTIAGKARIVEGEGEDAILIELEATNPVVVSMLKNSLVGISLVPTNRSPFYIEVVD
ncbi:hypothetical protein PP914_gp113 [Arthrobacter phage Qui]|uniref:Uncharacterized protein n=1 Tax=Arthrobacter phage Qui TaxID=2603260 RepID=A0A5B8WGI2_9CAUD|nr:hypothetical protein PP914_gp113 [Arthrobacter phage Qui]QED11603.1 hypothetical protein SEA_QUI_113 [Arthrobacter phage Qui]QOC56435.1 hypothetical protein SEA_PAELLA_113 [Arthrobacter phage Paella]